MDQLLYHARQVFPTTWAAAEGLRLQVHRRLLQVESRGRRLSQRAAIRLPVRVETTEQGVLLREPARLENVSFQGAFFVSPRHYELRQAVTLVIPLRGQDEDQFVESGYGPERPTEFRLRGYVVRTEPQTTNGGWMGVAVLFPGSPTPQPPLHPVLSRPPAKPD